MRKPIFLLLLLLPLVALSQFDYFPPDTNTFIPFLSRKADGWRLTTTNLYNYTPDGSPYGLNWIYYFEHSWLENTRFFGGGTNEWLIVLDNKFKFGTNGSLTLPGPIHAGESFDIYLDDRSEPLVHLDYSDVDYVSINGTLSVQEMTILNGYIVLAETNAAPVNKTNPVAWKEIQCGQETYKIPLYK